MKISALRAARIAWLVFLAGGILCGVLAMAAERSALSPVRQVCGNPVPVEIKGRFVAVCPSLAARLRLSFAGFVIFALLTLVSGIVAGELKKDGSDRD